MLNMGQNGFQITKQYARDRDSNFPLAFLADPFPGPYLEVLQAALANVKWRWNEGIILETSRVAQRRGYNAQQKR
jgi:hypothetical protein